MNIFCPFYHHFKDTLFCKLKCNRELICAPFQTLQQEKGREIRWNLFQYIQKFPDKKYKVFLIPKPEGRTVMKNYVCIKENQIDILSEEQITEKVKAGEFYKEYFEIGKEMELVIKLIAKSQVKKPKKPVVPKKEQN